MASNTFQIHAGDGFSMSQKSASNVIDRVTKALCSKASMFIKFPSTDFDVNRSKHEFYALCGMPHTIGAIDCSQVRLEVSYLISSLVAYF